MTAVGTPRNATAGAPARDTHTAPLSWRARRAGPLFVGAALVLLLVQPVGALPTKGWIPLILGLSYLASAALGGRRAALWSPGIIVAGWALAPMLTNYGIDAGGQFYLILGAALVIAALAGDRGIAISRMSMALPVVGIGVVMFIAPFVGAWLTTVLAVSMVGWGAWELRPRQVPEPVGTR
jgi:hypothetical protein